MTRRQVLELSDIEWELACLWAKGGHTKKLRRLLLDSRQPIPDVARAFLAQLLDAGLHGETFIKSKRGVGRKVDEEDATYIRFLLRNHAKAQARSLGTKKKLISLLAKKYGCSEGTIRDIDEMRGAYAEKGR